MSPLQRQPHRHRQPVAAPTAAEVATALQEPPAAPEQAEGKASLEITSTAPEDGFVFDLLADQDGGAAIVVPIIPLPSPKAKGARTKKEKVAEATPAMEIPLEPEPEPNPTEPSFDEALTRRILDAAADMAWAQAGNERERDQIGFSNADYRLGAVLASSRDVAGCATLLYAYPRQIETYGLSRADLAPAIPEEDRDLPGRTAASSHLTRFRSQYNQQAAWKAHEGGVMVVPYGVPWSDLRVLQNHGKTTPNGVFVEAHHVESLLRNFKASVIDREGLQTYAAAHAVKQEAVVVKEPTVALSFTEQGRGLYRVDWTNPFSPEGAEVRNAVKLVGAKFDSGTWVMSEKAVRVLSVLLEDNPDACAESSPFPARRANTVVRREAELLKNGVMAIQVVRATPAEIRFETLKRNDELGTICQLVGAKYNQNSYSMPTSVLPKFLDAVEGAKTLDATDLFREGMTMLRQQVARLKQSAQFLDGKAITDTPTGIVFRPHQVTGVRFLIVAGANTPGQRGAILADDMGLGKAQPLTARILTPEGWTFMGDINVGDTVMRRNGQTTRVSGVFPQGERMVYRITFSDNTTAECCEEHLWAVQTTNHRKRGGPFQVKELQEIAKELTWGTKGNAKWYIPMASPIQFPERDLPIHPYLLGLLLGDGDISKHCVQMSTADQEILDRIAAILPEEMQLAKAPGEYDYRIMAPRTLVENTKAFGVKFASNKLTTALRELDLMGTNSTTKFIPEPYLFGSVDQRLEILRGLMDTDGSVCGGHLEYSTVSSELASGVQELIQSLGGTARVTVKRTSWTYLGEKKVGTAYRVSISLPGEIMPFHLGRKKAGVGNRPKYPPSRAIKKVEPIGVEPVQCIRVEAEDHLYITDGYVVTHNTVQSMIACNERDPDGRILVACPAIAKVNWKREIAKFIGEDAEARTQIIKTGKDTIKPGMRWLIVNYNLLKAMEDKLKEWNPTSAILDEAQVLTNLDTQQTKILAGFQKKETDPRTGRTFRREVPGLVDVCHNVFPLTGTPINNKPKEMFALLKLIRHPLAADYLEFTRRFCDGHEVEVGSKTIWDDTGASNLEELGRILQDSFLRRMKAGPNGVLEGFPEKTYQPYPVELDEKGRKLYLDALASVSKEADELGGVLSVAEGAGSRKGKADALRMLTAVKQATALAKIPASIEFVENIVEQGEKILVFSNYTDVLDQLQEKFGEKAVRIDGGVTGTKRTVAEDLFQTSPDKTILLGNVKACGVAINLTAATKVVFVDRPWTPGAIDQASDRAWRIGQTQPVTVYFLEAPDTFDEQLAKVVEEKREATEQIEKGLNGDPLNDEPSASDIMALAKALDAERKRVLAKKK